MNPRGSNGGTPVRRVLELETRDRERQFGREGVAGAPPFGRVPSNWSIDALKCSHYLGGMKNITLSARDEAIERGRQVARSRNTTLNELFRDWLEQLGDGELREQAYRQQMERLRGRVRTGGRKFSREEMNER